MPHLTRLQATFQFPSPYQVHLMAGALTERGTQRQCLYRYDADGINANLWLLSEKPPKLQALAAWQAASMEIDLSGIQAGERKGFRVRVNPSICRRGRRQDLAAILKAAGKATWKEAQQLAVEEWFGRRQEQLGFQVEDIRLDQMTWQRVEAPQGRMIQFGAADVTGILTVTDKARFLASVANGVGAERAFGCGLLFIYDLA